MTHTRSVPLLPLLPEAISLFGEICGNHRAGSPEPVSYPSMDGQGAKEHLSHLMDELDVNLKEDRGLDSLGYLVNNSQARGEHRVRAQSLLHVRDSHFACCVGVPCQS